MQLNTIVDYLDPEQDKTHPRNFQITFWKDFLNDIKFGNLFALEHDIIINSADIPPVMKNDRGWVEFAKTYKIYKTKNGKPYLFSPYLTEILSNTFQEDLNYDDLPEEFYGYLELPNLKDEYGVNILGIFVCIYMIEEEKALKIVAITDEGKIERELTDMFLIPKGTKKHKVRFTAINWLYITLFKGDTFVEAYKKAKITNTISPFCASKPIIDDAKIWRSTLLNALVFIKYCTDNQLEKLNEFATKKSKAEVERRLYTESPYTFCDIERKTFGIDSTFVVGHWRFQPCGTKRMNKKLIYIAPHKRTYNKTIEGSDHDSTTTSL